jgi:hypothetical protein
MQALNELEFACRLDLKPLRKPLKYKGKGHENYAEGKFWKENSATQRINGFDPRTIGF